MSHHHYTKAYFVKRDYLDLHIAASINLLAQKHHVSSILDVGCGTGLLVKYLKNLGYQAKGCDKYFTSRSIIHASATKLPFRAKSYDMITSISVIEHLTLPQTHRFLAESYRVLRPGGVLFIVTPNLASPFRLLAGKKWFGYTDPTHLTYFTPQSLCPLTKKFGFVGCQFKFPISTSVTFELHLPGFIRSWPKPIKHFITYLLISSPLATYRDSFWLAVYKR